jgi:hypothetical protein
MLEMRVAASVDWMRSDEGRVARDDDTGRLVSSGATWKKD